MSKVKRKKKTVNVKQEEEAKTLGEGIPVEDASSSPDIPQRTWRYPWERAWKEGLEVKWK